MRQAEAQLLADPAHGDVLGRIDPTIRRMPSARPISISRDSIAVPSPPGPPRESCESVPRFWKRSEISRANSASPVLRILLSRPTPRTSRPPSASGPVRSATSDHLAVVVDEADARQPLVRDPRRELHRVEVAERDAFAPRACRGRPPAAARPRGGSAGGAAPCRRWPSRT